MSSWLHGFKALIAALASLVALIASIVGILITVGVIKVGGDDAPRNLPPIVGNITLDTTLAINGKPLRAAVGVSDPDRDELIIQWTSNSAGRFPQGDTGKSVIFEPPPSGASFQLTAIISDGKNSPVRASENFVLATPTPVPGSETPTPQPTATPNALLTAPTKMELAPDLKFTEPTPTPSPPPLTDITGIWNYGQGYLEIGPSFGGNFEYIDYNAFGIEVGQGVATRQGAGYALEGAELVVNPFTTETEVLVYTGTLEVVDGNSLQARLRFQNQESSVLNLTRVNFGF